MKNVYSFLGHSHLLLSAILVFLFAGTIYAQSTDIKLPTEADSTSNCRVLNSAGVTRLQVNSDGGFFLAGVFGTGVIPIKGTGVRFAWYPAKAAFRAGYSGSGHWDDANIGNYSVSMGYMPTASGEYSTALGDRTTAIGLGSTALGNSTTASGEYSTATGYVTTASGSRSTAMSAQTTASGDYSIAMGRSTTASGYCSTTMGRSTTASSYYSTAMGYSTAADGDYSLAAGNYSTASGSYSVAMGDHAIASGDRSIAMGNYIKAIYDGSFSIGDNSKTTYDSSSTNNQMTMRFAGGYRLFSNAACSTGVYMNGGVGGWNNISDRNKKENFRLVDGEQILSKIRAMPVTEWNYKGTDPSVKYIGPVAQDFYSAFHLGGSDSLGINSICMDGVNIAAIQALEKRTAELQKANEKIELIEKRIEKLEQIISSSAANNNSSTINNK